eukprot:TRINITY_DN14750_c0_g1_i1.p1 TRINITY_DN14750_c0_g1~~TRINITY_DN14750_c0_g1_i1.p1  ORF type:complete len:948 (+),score=207.83 TRINITY_DN14750_c0_g1_i1:88-2931(+)
MPVEPREDPEEGELAEASPTAAADAAEPPPAAEPPAAEPAEAAAPPPPPPDSAAPPEAEPPSPNASAEAAPEPEAARPNSAVPEAACADSTVHGSGCSAGPAGGPAAESTRSARPQSAPIQRAARGLGPPPGSTCRPTPSRLVSPQRPRVPTTAVMELCSAPRRGIPSRAPALYSPAPEPGSPAAHAAGDGDSSPDRSPIQRRSESPRRMRQHPAAASPLQRRTESPRRMRHKRAVSPQLEEAESPHRARQGGAPQSRADSPHRMRQPPPQWDAAVAPPLREPGGGVGAPGPPQPAARSAAAQRGHSPAPLQGCPASAAGPPACGGGPAREGYASPPAPPPCGRSSPQHRTESPRRRRQHPAAASPLLQHGAPAARSTPEPAEPVQSKSPPRAAAQGGGGDLPGPPAHAPSWEPHPAACAAARARSVTPLRQPGSSTRRALSPPREDPAERLLRLYARAALEGRDALDLPPAVQERHQSPLRQHSPPNPDSPRMKAASILAALDGRESVWSRAGAVHNPNGPTAPSPGPDRARARQRRAQRFLSPSRRGRSPHPGMQAASPRARSPVRQRPPPPELLSPVGCRATGMDEWLAWLRAGSLVGDLPSAAAAAAVAAAARAEHEAAAAAAEAVAAAAAAPPPVPAGHAAAAAGWLGGSGLRSRTPPCGPAFLPPGAPVRSTPAAPLDDPARAAPSPCTDHAGRPQREPPAPQRPPALSAAGGASSDPTGRAVSPRRIRGGRAAGSRPASPEAGLSPSAAASRGCSPYRSPRRNPGSGARSAAQRRNVSPSPGKPAWQPRPAPPGSAAQLLSALEPASEGLAATAQSEPGPAGRPGSPAAPLPTPRRPLSSPTRSRAQQHDRPRTPVLVRRLLESFRSEALAAAFERMLFSELPGGLVELRGFSAADIAAVMDDFWSAHEGAASSLRRGAINKAAAALAKSPVHHSAGRAR